MGEFWVPTAGAGTDTDAIHDNVSAEISAITEKVTPVGNDLLVIEDSAASNAKKRLKISNLPSAAGSWTDYSGTFSWLGRSSNPAIGNGTIDARYRSHGNTVHFMIKIVMGSTTTFGSGVWSVTLPVDPAVDEIWHPMGAGIILDAGAIVRPITGAWIDSTTEVDLISDAGQLTPSVPWTWANGDVLSLGGSYEIA